MCPYQEQLDWQKIRCGPMARFLRGTADWKETRPAFEKVRDEAF